MSEYKVRPARYPSELRYDDSGWIVSKTHEDGTEDDLAFCQTETLAQTLMQRLEGGEPAPIRCVIAGRNANGEPDLAFVNVSCTTHERDSGWHYAAARRWATENDFAGPFVVFEENDPPKPVFNLFEWDSADVVLVEARDRVDEDA